MFQFCKGSPPGLRRPDGTRATRLPRGFVQQSRRFRAVRSLPAALIVLALGANSHAALPESRPTALGASQLIDIARKDNRDMQVACYAIDAARAKLLQAGLRSNPRLDLSAHSDFLFRNEGEYATSIGISQQFPISG